MYHFFFSSIFSINSRFNNPLRGKHTFIIAERRDSPSFAVVGSSVGTCLNTFYFFPLNLWAVRYEASHKKLVARYMYPCPSRRICKYGVVLDFLHRLCCVSLGRVTCHLYRYKYIFPFFGVRLWRAQGPGSGSSNTFWLGARLIPALIVCTGIICL